MGEYAWCTKVNNNSNILVIDIGGTKTNVALVAGDDSRITVLNNKSFSTFTNPLDEIKKIQELCSSFVSKPEIVLLSLPGYWEEGILKETNFLEGWLGFPFINELKSKLGTQNCIFETDVICGALGEYNALSKKNNSMLYINLGTGIGAAFIDRHGKPFKSSEKLSLRIQKLVVPYSEGIFSGVDLISGGTLAQFSGFNSVESLYAAYRIADTKAVDIISRAQVQLAAWLINLFYLFAPDTIVLGGGLTKDFEVLAEGAIDIANEELGRKVEVIPSKLGELAPIYGAYINYCCGRE